MTWGERWRKSAFSNSCQAWRHIFARRGVSRRPGAGVKGNRRLLAEGIWFGFALLSLPLRSGQPFSLRMGSLSRRSSIQAKAKYPPRLVLWTHAPRAFAKTRALTPHACAVSQFDHPDRCRGVVMAHHFFRKSAGYEEFREGAYSQKARVGSISLDGESAFIHSTNVNAFHLRNETAR